MIFAVSFRNKDIYHLGRDRNNSNFNNTIGSKALCGVNIPVQFNTPLFDVEISYRSCIKCQKIIEKEFVLVTYTGSTHLKNE